MPQTKSPRSRSEVPRAAPISVYLETFLDQKGRRNLPLSVAQTVWSLRLQGPTCDLTDGALAGLVAERAVERGCDVVFDADLLAVR